MTGMVMTIPPRCVGCKHTQLVEVEEDRLARWRSGEHVQDVWPEWTPGQREVLVTGTHNECWDRMFGDGRVSEVASEAEVMMFVTDFATRQGATFYQALAFYLWVADPEHLERANLTMGEAWEEWSTRGD